MGILAWIVIGLVAGWLAHAVLGGRGGLFGNIAVGLIGAIVGGFLFDKLQPARHAGFLGKPDYRHHRCDRLSADLAGHSKGMIDSALRGRGRGRK